ncbi:MAG: GNAT family N-acetyltransferase [Phycicoccus sp.]
MNEPDDAPRGGGPGHPGAAGVIRAAVPGDAAALVALRAVMFAAMGTDDAALVDSRWRRAAHDWFAGRVGTAGVHVVVAEVGGEVVSCAVGEVTGLIPGPSAPHGSVGLISNVATFAGHRGHGHAAGCTNELLRWFEEETDVSRVDLFATAGGERIYGQHGFVRSDFPAMRRRMVRA